MPWRDLGAVLESVTGRRLVRLPLSGSLMRTAGRVMDRVIPYLPVELPMPLTEEAMGYATQWVPLDNTRVEEELQFRFRPLEETMADTVSWLHRAGHINSRQAGSLAEAA